MKSCVTSSSSQAYQQGVAMIEALIGMVLIALSLLVMAGLQGNAFKYQKSAGNRFVASALVGELAESIEANRAGAAAGKYAMALTSSASTSSSDCVSMHCTPAELASYDLAQWTTRVFAALPMKDVRIVSGTTGSGGLASYTITVRWDEPRGNQKYASEGATETLQYVLVKVVRDAMPTT